MEGQSTDDHELDDIEAPHAGGDPAPPEIEGSNDFELDDIEAPHAGRDPAPPEIEGSRDFELDDIEAPHAGGDPAPPEIEGSRDFELDDIEGPHAGGDPAPPEIEGSNDFELDDIEAPHAGRDPAPPEIEGSRDFELDDIEAPHAGGDPAPPEREGSNDFELDDIEAPHAGRDPAPPEIEGSRDFELDDIEAPHAGGDPAPPERDGSNNFELDDIEAPHAGRDPAPPEIEGSRDFELDDIEAPHAGGDPAPPEREGSNDFELDDIEAPHAGGNPAPPEIEGKTIAHAVGDEPADIEGAENGKPAAPPQTEEAGKQDASEKPGEVDKQDNAEKLAENGEPPAPPQTEEAGKQDASEKPGEVDKQDNAEKPAENGEPPAPPQTEEAGKQDASEKPGEVDKQDNAEKLAENGEPAAPPQTEEAGKQDASEKPGEFEKQEAGKKEKAAAAKSHQAKQTNMKQNMKGHSQGSQARTQSAPCKGQGIRQGAYKASIDLPPKWTMRGRTSFGSPFKSAKAAEEGGMAGDMSSKYNEIRPRAPAWSMMPRSSGITKTPDQPGPGEYLQPSTLYGSHPQLPVPGRICKSTQSRTGPTDQVGEMKNNPSPHDYNTVMSGPNNSHKFGRADQVSAPKFTMRAKVSFGSQFKSAKAAEEGGMAGDMSSKYNEIRPRAPAWSMMPRSSGITKTPDQPGPGEYLQPSTLYGSHPQLPVPGRICKSTQSRTGPTDQVGEMKNNPSPHDYNTVMSGPNNSHKFGRADQVSAPKFTMRAKVSFGSQFKSAKAAEEGGMAGDMSSKYNEIRPRAPAWSMMPRSSGITKTPDQPGPGEYLQPSTLYGSHPQLPVPGRICKSTQSRTGPTDQVGEMKNNPSPHDYNTVMSGPNNSHKFGRADQVSAPKFTMRAKVSFGSQFKSAKAAEEGGMAGDMSSKYNEIRPRAPAWSMMPRSSGITKTPDQPGPGEYLQPSTLYGSHPQLPVPGRICKSTQSRTGPTDQVGEMKNNPSPQDYYT